MEIRSNYGQTFIKKEVNSPPPGSPQAAIPRPPNLTSPDATSTSSAGLSASVMEEINPAIQHNVMHLQQEHDFQQQVLRRKYEDQKQQLEKQLQLHLNYLEQKKQKADEERIEKQRIEAIKNKGKEVYSAVASHEVKQRLQEMILRKNQTNASSSSAGQKASTNIRNWPQGHIHGVNEDFPPLRKTASEPNICLKVRIKPRVNERRSSPLVSRKDRIPGHSRRRNLVHVDSASTPDSGQNSPPNGLPASRSSSGSTPIHEEGSGSPYGATNQGGSCSDLTHPFTSLPNISLGRPPHSTHGESMKLAMVSETEMVSAAKAGMPLTGHLMPSTLPNYPALPVIENSEPTASVTTGVCGRIAAMEATGGTPPSPLIGNMYTVGVVPGHAEAQARFRTLQRPLGRTQSAPLPLGHPMLAGAPPTFLSHVHPGPSNMHQYEYKLEHHPHSLIKQQIRETVMKRTGSKNHVENVEEETPDAVARAIGADKLPEEELAESAQEEAEEVIDLTEKKMDVGGDGSARLYWGNASGVAATGMSAGGIYHHDRGVPLLSYQRELVGPKAAAYTGAIVGPRSGSHLARPLTRAQSSPSVTLPAPGSPQEPMSVNKQGATTGLAYDSLMKKHQCICGEVGHHPEHGGRIQAIWNRLQDTGLTQRCNRVRSRKATSEEIQSCHTEAYTSFFGTYPLPSHRAHFDIRKLEVPIKNFVRLQCGGIGVDSDTTWNNLHTSSAARMAVGCVLELAFKVASGELRNGFAIVRPPGHHAEHQQAMGFCFFNNISIAAKQLQEKYNYDKILILDWDVHHGNGTQGFFYEDPHILYLSLHRYDEGSFFPGTGGPNEVGEGDGYGFNVNISWAGGLNPAMGDAEYLAAFRSVVMPIARDFDPDIILVSAGFDAAEGHPPPLGGYKVSPSCFAFMTKELTRLAKGKVVLALEGGYSVDVICDCVHACVQALLDEEIPPISEQELTRRPCSNAIETLQNVIAIQTIHWPVVRKGSSLVGLTALEARGREEEQETVSAMASLRVDQHSSHNPSPEPVSKSPVTSSASGYLNDEEEPMDQDNDSK